MSNIHLIHINPVKIRLWKRRPARAKEKKEVLTKEPFLYKQQVDRLKECLGQLKSNRNVINSGIYSYLEVFLYPEEINKKYLDFLIKKGLEVKKKINIGSGMQVYFKINNIEKVLDYFSEATAQFEKFSNESISKEGFTEKTISIWHSFQLSTSQIKNKVKTYLKPFSCIRLEVNFIEEISLKEFNNFVSSVASESGIKTTTYGSTIEIESESESVGKTADFIDKLAMLDKIRFISLSEFVSMIEAPLGGGLKEQINAKIKEIDPRAPVIAVVDSGVQAGYLTNGFLLKGLDYTKDHGDGRLDSCGHGTAVACEIVYGKNIVDYFLKKEIDYLLPIFRIFPVRVITDYKNQTVEYKKIFKEGGEFAKAIQKYNIKIINLSITHSVPKDFDEFKLSETALILDRFARQYNVLFVVCTGNIGFKKLEELAQKYPDLVFFDRFDKKIINGDLEKEINIAPPADLLSGISVGSCFKQKNKYVVSSFSRSYSLDNIRGNNKKPEVLSPGGDYPFDLISKPARFDSNMGRSPYICRDFKHLEFGLGTSYSTPKVCRALGIGLLKYQNFTPLSLKSVFLHKINSDKYKISLRKFGTMAGIGLSDLQPNSVLFHSSFAGQGGLIEEDEDKFFSDTEDEVTMVINGKIQNKQILTYEIPIVKMLGDGTKNKTNKLLLKLSVCIFPSSKENEVFNLRDANEFHISAAAHLKSLPIIYTKESEGGKKYSNQCANGKSKEMLVPWTADYFLKEYPTFSIKNKSFIKDDLLNILHNDDTIYLSVRGIHNNSENNEIKEFVLVFSVEDLGATGQIKNYINITI